MKKYPHYLIPRVLKIWLAYKSDVVCLPTYQIKGPSVTIFLQKKEAIW